MAHKMKTSLKIGLYIARAIIWFLLFITSPIYEYLYEDQRKKKIPPVTNPLIMKSAVQLAKMIRSKQVTSYEVVEAFIDRIEQVDKFVNALVINRFAEARKEAAEVDKILASDTLDNKYSEENMPYLGVPFTAKEAFATTGLPNTSGLLAAKDRIASKDADVVANLRAAGAISLGLTNCSELCMWMESSNLIYGRTNNAYHLGRIVGGSSGGEGCIQSYCGSPMGVGSDIGGSIRMPAYFNGVFGHKASTGVVSNIGQYPNAKGEAQTYLSTGPICKYFEDIVPMLKVMAGPEDTAKLKLDEKVDLKKIKIYYMLENGSLLSRPVDNQLKDCIHKVKEHFKTDVAASVEPVCFDLLAMSFFIWSAKMSSGGNDDFCTMMGADGPPVKPLKELLYWIRGRPRHTLAAIGLGLTEKLAQNDESNQRLCKLNDKLKEQITNILGDDGVLLYPPHPIPAPYHNQALIMFPNFEYTGIFNTLGFPVTQCPMGLSKEGVPLGLQVVSTHLNDHLTLAVTAEIDRVFGGWVPPSEINC